MPAAHLLGCENNTNFLFITFLSSPYIRRIKPFQMDHGGALHVPFLLRRAYSIDLRRAVCSNAIRWRCGKLFIGVSLCNFI